jgi:hypothetical protein
VTPVVCLSCAGGRSCAFKDAQGNPLNVSLPARPQTDVAAISFDKAARCTTSPTPGTSVGDQSGRLWGFEQGATCAYKSKNNAPIFYTGYKAPATAVKTEE